MERHIKTLIIAVTFLLANTFNSWAQSKANVFPPEKFVVLQAKLPNGKPIVGSINKAYKNYTNKAIYPWCLKLTIALDLKNCTDNGLPVKMESDIANKFEDEILKQVAARATAHYVGHMYNDTFLDVYVYLDDPKKVDQYLKTQINKKGQTRPIAYEIKQDPNWQTIEPFMK